MTTFASLASSAKRPFLYLVLFMAGALAQAITDARADGWYDWIVEPDGNLHPNTERALLEGYHFDPVAAQKPQDFAVQFLTLPREPGEGIAEYEVESIRKRFPGYDPEKPLAKKPFAMLRWWHRRVIGQLYGWKHPDGYRRFRRGFVTTSKKSGKTSTLAMLPLYELLAGRVPEKEVYVVATTEDQAAYLFKKTHAMLQRSNRLRTLLTPRYSTRVLLNPATESIFKTLPADPDTVQGIQPNLLILDELHAWRNREVYDALIYGDIRRVDSLTLSITTAGDDLEGIGYEEYEAAKELLDPNNDRCELDSFAFIAEAGRDPVTQQYVKDEAGNEYDWTSDEAILWANPSLWENPQPLPKIRQMRTTALASPNKKRNYIRYICNRYVSSEGGDLLIDPSRWKLCTADIADHQGDKCWVGLDLARVEDLVACAMCWEGPEPGTYDLKVRFWMPEEGIDEKARKWKLPSLYSWIEAGWIETTPGPSIDEATLRWAISGVALDETGEALDKRNPDSIAEQYKVQELAFDRYQAANLVIRQMDDYDGMPCFEHGQGYVGMSAPTKTFQQLILQSKIRHDGNPVMHWMTRHCMADIDPAENVKPNKRKSRFKIDGIVASIMAAGRAVAGGSNRNVYEDRGVKSF